VVAAQALGSVALVGVLGTAIVVSIPRPAEDAAMIAQDASGGTEGQSAPFVDQDTAIENGMLKAQECGRAPVTPPLLGWTVDVAPSPLAGPGEVGVRVTLGRDAPVPEAGTATITALTIVRDGLVVGHAFPVDAAVPIGPGPGEASPWEPVTWDAVASVESCDPSGAPLAVGTYGVLVRIQYGSESSSEPIDPPVASIDIG
jgi:hypothetical protein